MNRPIDVMNVGLLCADVPLRLPCEELDFSEDSIDVGAISVVSGGDAANAAITLSRLGMRSALSTLVGDDAFGRGILQLVGQSGVITDYIKAVPGLDTSVSVVMIKQSGERLFLYCDSSIKTITIDDIATSEFKLAKHVNYGSMCSLPALDPDAAKLLRMAKEAGCTTSMDITGGTHMISLEAAASSLRYVDYFMPSYREAQIMTGESEPGRMADALIKATGEKTVVIKLGEQGCFVKSKDRSFTAPAYKVSPIDTTGAGDSFVGGFLTGLMKGWELERCARFANGAAGFNTRFLGATAREMSFERVLEFMGEKGW